MGIEPGKKAARPKNGCINIVLRSPAIIIFHSRTETKEPFNQKFMTVEYIRYKIQPDKREAFVEAYGKAAMQLDSSEYCLAYELAECEEEAGSFILRIEWMSTEMHLNGFRKSKEFQEFFTLVKPFFSDIQEMRHYSTTTVARRKQV